MLKSFCISLGLFLVLDFIWLGLVMNRFNVQQLQAIGRISNGKFEVAYVPAVVVYLLMAVLMAVFVMPLSEQRTLLQTFGLGCLLGLCVYGIFDMTNTAILKNYPLPFALVDMAWGTFLFGTVAMLVKLWR